jgi:O-antigen ligase
VVNINSNNKIRHGLILLFFVALPFERLLTLDVAGYTLKLSYILGLIIIIDALVLLVKKQINLTLYRDELWLLLFGLLAIMTILWSIDWRRSFVISLTIVFMLVLFYFLRRLIDAKLREKIISVFVIMGVLLSLFAIWQFFIDKTSLSYLSYLRPEYTSGVFTFARVQSTFLEPLYFANFLLVPIFFCLYRLGQKPNLSNNLILMVLSLAFFLTLSRGAFLALAISIFVVGLIRLIYQRDKINGYMKQIFIMIFSFALALLCVFAVAGKTGLSQYFGHTTFTDISEQGSVADRQSTIQVAVEQSLKHPFGLGAGAFGALPQYRDEIAQEGYQTVNNLYLEITVEEGFLGLILILLFIWNYALSLVQNFNDDLSPRPSTVSARSGQSNREQMARDGTIRNSGRLWTTLVMGLFLAILIQYLFFSTIYIIYIWAVLALLSPKLNIKNQK